MPPPRPSTTSNSRERAIALQAATVAEVLAGAGCTWVVQYLAAGHLQQLQRFIDAAVVEPELKKEAEALYRQGTIRYGSIARVDPAAQRRAEAVLRSGPKAGAGDDRVRVDIQRILGADALKPLTDNPDEAAYLEEVRKRLDESGIWLRLAPKVMRDTKDPSRWTVNPRQFDVWFSLGANGDRIPLKTGRIDREVLMETTCIGAGYYRAVNLGPVQKQLDELAQRLEREIDVMSEHHQSLNRLRKSTNSAIVGISDLAGGADFPPLSLWERPLGLLKLAREMGSKGSTFGCRASLMMAAVLTQEAAQDLSDYVNKSTAGAEWGAKAAKVVQVTAEIAFAALSVVGMLRAGVVTIAMVEKEAAKYGARNPGWAGNIKRVARAAAGGRKGQNPKGAGTGFHKW